MTSSDLTKVGSFQESVYLFDQRLMEAIGKSHSDMSGNSSSGLKSPFLRKIVLLTTTKSSDIGGHW